METLFAQVVGQVVQHVGQYSFQVVALVAVVGVCIVHGAVKQLVSSNR